MDYKSNSSCSSPSKDMKNPDRCGLPYGTPVPVLPVRNNLRRPNSSHFPPGGGFHIRKGLASKCSWKCTAIVFITLSVVLIGALIYISGMYLFCTEFDMPLPNLAPIFTVIILLKPQLNSYFQLRVFSTGLIRIRKRAPS